MKLNINTLNIKSLITDKKLYEWEEEFQSVRFGEREEKRRILHQIEIRKNLVSQGRRQYKSIWGWVSYKQTVEK